MDRNLIETDAARYARLQRESNAIHNRVTDLWAEYDRNLPYGSDTHLLTDIGALNARRDAIRDELPRV